MTQHGTARSSRWTVLLVALLLLAVAGCSASADDGETSNGVAQAPAPPSAPPSEQEYVALGDSFTSAPLVPVTDVANGCFRSSANYPALVARALGAELDDRSCGGADTSHFTRSQFPDVPAQLGAVKPGVDLVTIGIGGNDEKVFQQLVVRCPQLRATDPEGSPCRADMRSRGPDVLLSALRHTRERVTRILRSVQRRAPEAKVLVVGYPQIVSADNACRRLPLATGDFAYAQEVNRALTESLRLAARATGATYVDVWTASRGHDICSEDPWVNGSVTDQKRAAAYHPFAKEQLAVADLVLRAYRG